MNNNQYTELYDMCLNHGMNQIEASRQANELLKERNNHSTRKNLITGHYGEVEFYNDFFKYGYDFNNGNTVKTIYTGHDPELMGRADFINYALKSIADIKMTWFDNKPHIDGINKYYNQGILLGYIPFVIIMIYAQNDFTKIINKYVMNINKFVNEYNNGNFDYMSDNKTIIDKNTGKLKKDCFRVNLKYCSNYDSFLSSCENRYNKLWVPCS